MTSSSRGNWGSKFGFILAASGSAVGLGNIWRFPYAAGENGGALFVLIYLVSILLIGLPILIAETALGRFSGKNPVGAIKAIKPKGPWKLLGYLGVLTGIMILSYYAMIAGWTVGYFFKAVTGKLKNITSANAENLYNSFTGDTLLQIALLTFFLLITIYVVSRGVSNGIERFAKVLMPGLLIILVILLVRSLTLPGAEKGLEFYLKPDFTKLNIKVIISAMGQAFFSLSLGMGCMITYGSYLRKKEHLPSATAWVVLFDTSIAIMAGLIIFPALLSQGMDPAAGEGIMFNVLPVLFAKIPGGMIFGPLFFLLLCIAALTSTVSLLEVATSYGIDEKKWSRKKSALIMGAVTLLVGIPSVLSYSEVAFFKKLPLLGISFFALMDKMWSELSLSIGALFLAIFVGYVWKTSNALKEITWEGAQKFRFAAIWSISVMFLGPILIIAILGMFVYNLFF
ncbi:MAG: sodium-dependent transporter [Candidatus Aminicenantes bacterium]|nr:sodium-dependent transporter [Candidatus Aminicenantes bacterium]